jgi:hypothetical protein
MKYLRIHAAPRAYASGALNNELRSSYFVSLWSDMEILLTTPAAMIAEKWAS